MSSVVALSSSGSLLAFLQIGLELRIDLETVFLCKPDFGVSLGEAARLHVDRGEVVVRFPVLGIDLDGSLPVGFSSLDVAVPELRAAERQQGLGRRTKRLGRLVPLILQISQVLLRPKQFQAIQVCRMVDDLAELANLVV